jgi:hypothetical protein
MPPITRGSLQEAAMPIDIIQAYADALHVATTLRAPPARQCRCLPVAAPAPTIRQPIVRWVARRLRRLDATDPALASAASKPAVPKI